MEKMLASHLEVDHFGNLKRCAEYSRSRNRLTELYSLADWATLGFAISLITSASFALADCFFVFLLPMRA